MCKMVRADANRTLLLVLHPRLLFPFPLLLLLMLVHPLLLHLHFILHKLCKGLLRLVKRIETEVIVGLDPIRTSLLLLLFLQFVQRRVTVLFYVFSVLLVLIYLTDNVIAICTVHSSTIQFPFLSIINFHDFRIN